MSLTNILKAITIIAWQSFSIMKPLKNSIMDAFEQFNSVGYVEKLKAQITLALVPTEHQALLEFLYNQSIHI